MKLLLVGLDNAGKTTIVKKFNGEDITTISPTLGFQINTMEYKGYKLNIWDVGGQKTIRAYWRNYFETTEGLIWVVDRCPNSHHPHHTAPATQPALTDQGIATAPIHCGSRTAGRSFTSCWGRSVSPAPLWCVRRHPPIRPASLAPSSGSTGVAALAGRPDPAHTVWVGAAWHGAADFREQAGVLGPHFTPHPSQ
jgi:hypothetical protein